MDNTISNQTKSCPSCLTVNGTSVAFCSKCGLPIGDYVNLDPVGQIKSQGHLFREATNRPRSLIILIGLWIYFGLTIVGMSLVIFFSNTDFHFLTDLFFIGILVVSCLILIKATKNYFNKK
ncbi:MAG: hypothetical protein ACQ9MH_24890 [Nitrospinales bacterium]